MTKGSSILIDVGGTSIIGGLYKHSSGKIEKIITKETGEYSYKNFMLKLDNLVEELKISDTVYIGISMNGQINKGYVYFSRILGGKIEKDLAEQFSTRYGLPTQIDNDVNCMALGYKFMTKNTSKYFLLLNLGTGIRASYFHETDILRGHKGFLGEIRDYIYVKELKQEININDLICGRGISNIYKILSGKEESAKAIYDLSLEGNHLCKKTITIFQKYLVNMFTRLSYNFNPEEIIIDGSLTRIVEENYEQILKSYKENCEPHFIAKIKTSHIPYSNLYGTLLLNN